MHRLFDAIQHHAPRIADDAITALVAMGAFGLFGALWRVCVAVVGG